MALDIAGLILLFLLFASVVAAAAYVRHLQRAMHDAAERAARAGLERAELLVGAVIAAQRADTERIVAAVDALAASSPWRRPPPPPVTMAHRDRVERPPEQAATSSADAWPELPEPPAVSARGARPERPERPDITFPSYSGGDAATNVRPDATINYRTLPASRERDR